MNVISTNALRSFIKKDRGFVIDVRPVAAYNGWEMQGEARGGHIRGAKSLPFKWTKYIDWIEIVRSKGIMPEHSIVLYGYNALETEQVGSFFNKAGYHDINIYNSFIDEWAGNPVFPMDHLARYQQLVSEKWLKSLISGDQPKHYENYKYIILHSHYRNREAYLSGHIPGAIDIDTLALESPETWNRRSPEELQEALQQHGISSDTTVILYGKFMTPNNADPFPGSAAAFFADGS